MAKMTVDEKYHYYREMALECCNIRNKAKTLKDYKYFQRKAEKFYGKAMRELKKL